jgi:hypothetical protein
VFFSVVANHNLLPDDDDDGDDWFCCNSLSAIAEDSFMAVMNKLVFVARVSLACGAKNIIIYYS